MPLREKLFENFVGKGENAGNQCFLPYQRQIPLFEPHVKCRLKMLPILDESTFLSFAKEKVAISDAFNM